MTGYDGDCTTFSPDGRIYQIDYAAKAAEQQGLGVALKVRDGVVMAVQRVQQSPLEEQSSSRYFQLSPRITALVVGMLADGRVLCARMTEYAASFARYYSREAPVGHLVGQMSQYMQEHTQYAGARPFGCSVLVTDGRELYQLFPSGDFINCFACAAGNKSANARVEVEKLMGEEPNRGQDRFGHLRKLRNEGGLLKDMGCDAALASCMRVIRAVLEESQDQKWYVEAVRVSAEAQLTRMPPVEAEQIAQDARA